MRRAVVLVLAMVAIATASPHAPKTLLSRLGGFQVALPAGFPTPRRTSQSIATDHGPVSVTTYASDSGQSAIVVRFVDYPKGTVTAATVDKVLQQAQRDSLQNVGARPTDSEPFRFNGHHGLSTRFRLATDGVGLYGRADYLVVSSRLFEIEYITPHAANLDLPATQTFFESFTLLH